MRPTREGQDRAKLSVRYFLYLADQACPGPLDRLLS